MKLINEIGNIYGYLTVTERAENNGTRAAWKCKCKCGNEIIVVGKNLRAGHVKSCGCLKKELLLERNMQRGGGDLTGKQFGKLTVISFDGWHTNGANKRDRMWKCKCECGNTCIVNHRYLRCGDTSSCGCSHSKGNATINRLLNSFNINYKSEYSFKDFITKNGGKYYYDFAVFDKNNILLFIIEYQGSIHFYAEGNGWNTEEALKERQIRDKEKFDFCNKNGIKLYYITYLDNIENKLKEILDEYRDELN